MFTIVRLCDLGFKCRMFSKYVGESRKLCCSHGHSIITGQLISSDEWGDSSATYR